MPAKAVRILVVGPVGPHLHALLERLACQGWRSYAVESCAEAETVLRTLQFDVVLAMEELADGSGFQLSQEVVRRSANLFVEVALSEGYLWLPAVELGKRTLGERAMAPAEFETQLVMLLSAHAGITLPGQPQSTSALKLPRGLASPADGGDWNRSEGLTAKKSLDAIAARTAFPRATSSARFARAAAVSASPARGIAAERTSRIQHRIALTSAAAAGAAGGKKKT